MTEISQHLGLNPDVGNSFFNTENKIKINIGKELCIHLVNLTDTKGKECLLSSASRFRVFGKQTLGIVSVKATFICFSPFWFYR